MTDTPTPAARHVLRSWTPPDPFAPDCDCTVADCGHVIPRYGCDQHHSNKTLRSIHPTDACPAAPTGDDQP